jgi:hypothetical protein
MRRLFLFTCACALMMTSAERRAAAASATANPSADTFVSAAQPNNNYGAAGALEVSAAGSSQGEYQTLMKFDLSGIKSSFDTTFGTGQWNVQSGSLQLTTALPGNPIFNANAAGQFGVSWMQNDSWLEGTGTPGGPPVNDGMTFSTLPAFLSGSDQSLGTFAFLGGNSGANIYPLNLASGLLSDITGGNAASLRLSAADGSVSYLFNSRSFGQVALRPILSVVAVAVPEPSVALIIGAGLGSFMLARRSGRG